MSPRTIHMIVCAVVVQWQDTRLSIGQQRFNSARRYEQTTGEPIMKTLLAIVLVLAACGDNHPDDPTFEPDAGVEVADAPYPGCSTIKPECAELTKISRLCAETGECYCNIGTKDDPMPIRCTWDGPQP